MSAAQTEQKNCVTNDCTLIPMPDLDVMAQAWYQDSLSEFDFTDSIKRVGIVFFHRGPMKAKQLIASGYWST